MNAIDAMENEFLKKGSRGLRFINYTSLISFFFAKIKLYFELCKSGNSEVEWFQELYIRN